MRKKLELKVQWKTNEYYDMNNITILILEEKYDAIVKAQQILNKNPEMDSIRIRIDQQCLASMSEYKLGYGFIVVGGGEGTALHFIGTDHHNSQYQVETGEFFLN